MSQSTNQLNSKYKTFWDLEFVTRPSTTIYNTVVTGNSTISDKILARMMFRNGYGISVVRGGHVSIGNYKYHSDDTYEIAVLDSKGKLDYSTPITPDVIQDLTIEQVTEYMIKIQQL